MTGPAGSLLILLAAAFPGRAAEPASEVWADKVLTPLRVYAQDLAEGDGQTSVESIDVESAASVLLKVSVENRFIDGAFLVHHLGDRTLRLPYDAVLPLEPADREALEVSLRRSPGLPLKRSAADRLVDLSGVLRAVWLKEAAEGRPRDRIFDDLMADWSYFGFKREGVENGPSIGSRARAQSLKFLRSQAGAPAPSGELRPGLRERAQEIWLKAQKTCVPTQFLITGEQIDAAAGRTAPREQSRVNTVLSRRAWDILLDLTLKEVRHRKRGGEGLWAALDPYAAMNLADALEGAARNPAGWPAAPARKSAPLFEDVTVGSGLAVESEDPLDRISVGAALLDYDRDGRIDLFVRMGRKGGRLFRNLGGFKFSDVTEAAGLSLTGDRAFAADYDNDGYPDLFLLGAYGGVNRLYHNERNGTFKDVTEKAGLSTSPELAVGAVWFDYDNDGLLDLYVVHSGRFLDGVTPSGADYGNGLAKRLYRNNGDGTFTDVTERAGLADRHWGWAAAAFDFDGDGRPDLFLCNCFGPSVLYRNRGDGTFVDVTSTAGIDVPTLCKGVSAGDFNHDGRMDLFVTAVSSPQGRVDYPFDPARFSGGYVGNAVWRDRLYENLGGGRFRDVYPEKFPEGGAGWGWNGFFVDYDLDGWQDIVEINGFYPDVLFYHDERKQVYHFDPAKGRFEAAPRGNGADFPGVSRGSVFADLDGDGCPDLIVTGLHGLKLLRNRCGQDKGRHWLRLALEGRRSNRDGIGARVRVRAGELDQTFDYGSEGGGAASSFSGGLLVGLGAHAKADSIEVRWPSGQTQEIRDAVADRTLAVREGEP